MPAVYRGSLAEHLRFGHCLEICGKAKEEAERFHISLGSEDFDRLKDSHIGLHITADFRTNQVIFQKYHLKNWCEEESISYETSKLLGEFKIYIVMADEKFHISINGEPLTSYQYRIRLSLLTLLQIDGDLEYVRQVDHRKYFPYPWPPIQVVEDRLQFSGDVPMPFRPGHVMVVSAQLMGNENGRFIIHLRNVWDLERQELHLSVRFDTRTMVRTSKTIPDEEHYSFDQEDTNGEFPFEDFSKPFKLAFGFVANEVKIAKDGQYLCQFAFRTPNVLSSVGGVKIFGIDDVRVKVNGVEHIKMDYLCTEFENYSILES